MVLRGRGAGLGRGRRGRPIARHHVFSFNPSPPTAAHTTPTYLTLLIPSPSPTRNRFVYSAFLTAVCLACPAVIIWLDPWRWEWPNALFLASGNAAALSFVFFAGPLFWPYFLLQTGVGYFRVYAMASGLAGSARSKGWKVTRKFGAGGGAVAAGCAILR